MRFTRYIVAAALAIACLVPSVASAQTSLFSDATSVRSSAVLTNSDVLSTTFTIPAAAKAVHYYVDFTKGSLTSASFAPAGAKDGNPAATGYYKSFGDTQTFTVDGRYHIRVPREDFGAHRYGAIYAVGNGTVTSSLAAVSIKYEY